MIYNQSSSVPGFFWHGTVYRTSDKKIVSVPFRPIPYRAHMFLHFSVLTLPQFLTIYRMDPKIWIDPNGNTSSIPYQIFENVLPYRSTPYWMIKIWVRNCSVLSTVRNTEQAQHGFSTVRMKTIYNYMCHFRRCKFCFRTLYWLKIDKLLISIIFVLLFHHV